jgi:putative oxidoreductase
MMRLDDGRVQRAAPLFARLSLGTAFLSGIMGSFGWWGKEVGYVDHHHFVEYTSHVHSFMPAWTIPYLAWLTTALELLFGVVLVLGVRTPEVALGSAALLFVFGTAMAIVMGIKSPIDYPVFSAAAASLRLVRAVGRS